MKKELYLYNRNNRLYAIYAVNTRDMVSSTNYYIVDIAYNRQAQYISKTTVQRLADKKLLVRVK